MSINIVPLFANQSSTREYSPLIMGIRTKFEEAKKTDARYLWVFNDYWNDGDTLSYHPVKKGQWPKDVSDAFMNSRKQPHATALIMGLDLEMSFEEQVSAEKCKFTVLDSFRLAPIVWIPIQTGAVPAKVREQEIAALQIYKR